MDSQEVLKEILLGYLKNPQHNITSITIKTSKETCSINLERMTYEYLEGWEAWMMVTEPKLIFDGVRGMKRLLQSMLAGNDLPIRFSLEIK